MSKGLRAVRPGEILSEKLGEMGMSQAEFARRTGFTPKHVNQIILGRTGYTAEAAICFERVTGIAAATWLGLQSNVRLVEARALLEVAKKAREHRRASLAEQVRQLPPLDIGGLNANDEWESHLVLDRAAVLAILEPS